MKCNVLYHAGDLGDCVAALPIARALGGSDILIGPGYCRESMKGARFESLKPLLELQPYVRSVKWVDSVNGATHNLSDFRSQHRRGDCLAISQARFLGVEASLDPWLTVGAPRNGLVLFARSQRYHNPNFPWFQLIRKYPEALFVGLRSEYEDFMSEFGGQGLHDKSFRNRTSYQPTDDLLDLARIISGCDLFIGNQSCPFWIAAGLGVPIIQETWYHDPNSIIERPNAVYTLKQPYDIRL